MSFRVDPKTGNQVWKHETACTGGGGITAVVYGGRLYGRGYRTDHYGDPDGFMLDINSGKRLGLFECSSLPVFAGDKCFYLNKNTLEGREISTGRILWSFAGDNGLGGSPVLVNDYLYVTSAREQLPTNKHKLYAVDPKTGKQVWSDTLTAFVEYGAWIAAGQGMLFVPQWNILTAYESAGHAAPK